MATMNISLPDAMKAWVEDQAKTGRYANASDYVRDLIRKDEERRREDEWLEAEAAVGLASGPAQPFDRIAFFREMMDKHGHKFSK